MACGSRPWTDAGFELRGLSKSARVKEILNLATLDFLTPEQLRAVRSSTSQDARKKSLRGFCHELFTDVSQNPARKSHTSRKHLASKCLTSSSVLYSHARDRLVCPLELLLFQGHSLETRVPSAMRQTSLRDMSGQGMALPCLATIVYALHHTDSLCV